MIVATEFTTYTQNSVRSHNYSHNKTVSWVDVGLPGWHGNASLC